ncbi:MAG: hypothetical protein WC410_01840 [Candidatus Paceibacterota bacterium]
MNFEFILQIIFILSFVAVLCFVRRKMPELVVLPEKDYFLNVKNLIKREEIKAKSYLKEKSVVWENSLHKFLLRVRILFLKADNKVLGLTQKLKQRAEKKKGPDEYWKDIKTSLKKKSSQEDKPA